MTTIPFSGPLAPAGAAIASTIVVIDVPPAAALAVAVLAAALAVGVLSARRRRGQARAGSPARAPQVAVPCALLGGER